MLPGLQRLLILLFFVFAGWSFQPTAHASPFGEGLFGADVPFGSLTSIAINLGNNVSLNLTPSGGNYSGTGSHTITVTSTDVVGYKLYVYSTGSTSLTNGSYSIPASGNSTPSTLAVNSWGYNTDASSNFVGMTTTPAVLKTATGPFKNGDDTTVTYGALADITKGAGDYTVTVTYTAVGLND
jgi:hypothetical protein